VLAFALELQALRLAPARTVSVFFSFDPVAAFAVGVVLLNQPIGWSAAFGATCVVVASIAVARHERPDEPAPQLAPG